MIIIVIAIEMTSSSSSDPKPLLATSSEHLASIGKTRSSLISRVRIDHPSLKFADHGRRESCVHIRVNDDTRKLRPLAIATRFHESVKIEHKDRNDFLSVPPMHWKHRKPSHNGHLRHRCFSQVQISDLRESTKQSGLRNRCGAVFRASLSSTGDSSSAESTLEDANSNPAVDRLSTRVVCHHTDPGNSVVEDLPSSPNVSRLRHHSEPITSASMMTTKMMMSPVLTSKRILSNPSTSSNENQLRNFHLMKHSPFLFHRSQSVPNTMLCSVPKVTISDFSSTYSTPYSEAVEEDNGYPDSYASTLPAHCVTLE
eukprot:TCALIF_10394-PA protein Name:"Protein of unknown function" AED:0.10 eAED:0.10 QI:37/1/0/1/0/0/2/0/312